MNRLFLTIASLIALCFSLSAAPYVHNIHVAPGERIADAIAEAKRVWDDSRRVTIISIEPGTYYEELTIDVPYLTLRNAAKHPSIEVAEGGVTAHKNAVRISWYCGHGYQYASMGKNFNYGGSRTRRWNATVLVDAPAFWAENIIFENSFNIYVSQAELNDTLLPMGPQVNLDTLRAFGVDIERLTWTEKEQPKRAMPVRPRVLNSTDVQQRLYRERASAISFTEKAQKCFLQNCRVLGRQDAFYGDHGASVWVKGGVLAGAVDYIFGGLRLMVENAQLVAMINSEKGDVCYISAGRCANRGIIEKARLNPAEHGLTIEALDSIPADEIQDGWMEFENCTVRFATTKELLHPGNAPVYLGRPWRWWGVTTFINTKAKKGVLSSERWSLGLTKGHPAPWCKEQKNK